MAELLIRTPGEADRRVPLPSRTITVGRHESCEVQILEVKASKRHFEVSPAASSVASASPCWVVTDLQSSNGTFVEEARVQRRLVEPGDAIRVGTTTLTVVSEEGARVGVRIAAAPGLPAGLAISKGLVFVDEPSDPEASGSSKGPEDDASDDDPTPAVEGPAPEVRRAAIRGRRSVVRAALLASVGVVAVLAVEFFVARIADKRQSDRAEASAYLDILAQRDREFSRVDSMFADFRRDYPMSARTPELQKLIDAKRRIDARTTEDEAELNRYVARTVRYTDSEVFGRLSELRERHGADGDRLRARLDRALSDLRAAAERSLADDRAVAEADAQRALAAGDAGAAIRRWRALLGAYPALSDDARASITAAMTAAAGAATRLADAALANAEKTADPDARRRILLDAIPGLDGTAELDRVASVLRRVTGGSFVTARSTAKGADPKRPGGESIGLLSADVLGKIAGAEALVRTRAWPAAAKAYDELLAMTASDRVKADWRSRRDDIARVMSLVDDLRKALGASKSGSLAVSMGGATWELAGVDDAGIRVRKAGVVTVTAWADVGMGDLVALLSHGASTPDRHLALATLAADLGDRRAAVVHLIPLIDVPTHRDLAWLTMAHRVEGRTSVPEGGYRVFDADLLDVAEWSRRTEARHLAELKVEAESLVRQASEDPVLDRLKSLRAKREELDRRRAHALLAIFNETHWPYPHSAPSIQGAYAAVTAECEKRWKAVAEVWDDAAKVSPGATATLDRLVARHAQIVAELTAKEIDCETMVAAMEPFAIYAGAQPMTIRTFFTSREEKDLLTYNRWVMDVYNVENASLASELEAEQIRITNEYRAMMGYAFAVEAGPASIDAIDSGTVVTILDQAKETGRRPLRAVRIEGRLVNSAHAHSEDMSKRGFFAHEAPANPATGEPATTPPDRMRKAGYLGSCGENIATSSNPMGAHLMWLHSSGHHRNILGGPWDDMGMGFAGGNATQNFGGGVTEAAIPAGVDPAAGPSVKRRKKDPK